jgi:hypothetical protein
MSQSPHTFLIERPISAAEAMRYPTNSHKPGDGGAPPYAAVPRSVGDTLRAQATFMGYADSFALLGVVLIIAILPVAFLRKGTASGGGAQLTSKSELSASAE